MDNFMIAAILLLVFIVVSRTLSEKAMKKLDPDKKVELIDIFSTGRTTQSVILIILMVAFFASLRWRVVPPLISYITYVAVILTFLVIQGFKSVKLLKKHNFPDFYIRSYLITTSLRFIGIVVFFALVSQGPTAL